jgi:hypothetical protein
MLERRTTRTRKRFPTNGRCLAEVRRREFISKNGEEQKDLLGELSFSGTSAMRFVVILGPSIRSV